MDLISYKLYYQPINRARNCLSKIKILRDEFNLGKRFQYKPQSKERPHVIRRAHLK